MKEIRILFDSYLLDKVVSEIKEFGIERYLVISKIKGEWRSDLKHFDNHVWPGTDSMVMIIVNDEDAKEIMESIRMIKEDLGERISMGAILSPIEDLIF